MTYNVRDRKGRFTKIRHSLRDSVTGQFVPEPVKRHSLRDEAGRFRPAKKYNVRDEKGRFASENYRHNLRDAVTGRFIPAKKNSQIPWEDFDDFLFSDSDECDCDWCRGTADDFEDAWGTCECSPEERMRDEDHDGTVFCANCLGDWPTEPETPVVEDDVIVIVIPIIG